MKLLVTTPLAVVVDIDDAVHVRAADESGAFGLLDHHTDFITALEITVVSWRRADGREGHCAVRGGTLVMRGGDTLMVATPEAIRGDDLGTLEQEALAALRAAADEETQARAADRRLQVAAIRQICGFLRPQPGRIGEPMTGKGQL